MTTAIYARVSSDRQKEDGTIESQVTCLLELARKHDLIVPQTQIFKDEGYSGKNLHRPDLERLRDLIAEGHIDKVLIYAPDRLSRQYAYQFLLLEEFKRVGAAVIFVKSPSGETAEDQLLLQFQGMIAEYERAQIAERSRRGKRHHAKTGSVNVLSGAPYGYRYIKKTPMCDAYYEVIEDQAVVVREVFNFYVHDQISINVIARRLSERKVATQKGKTKWDRSTIWAMLRNPAYMGLACFGKTEQVERRKITRPLRLRGGFSPRSSANRERPREEWIEIPVPPIIETETFDLAQDMLAINAKLSPRRTKDATLLQGMLSCGECSYAYYRTSTRTSKGKIYYYRCLGSDAYRYVDGAVCNSKPIRQDILDQLVWDQITGLLEDPTLIQKEIERRLQASTQARSSHQREENLTREQNRIRKARRNLLDAYQEGLLRLEELRERIPILNKKEESIKAELQAMAVALADDQLYLRVVNSLESFREVIQNSRTAMKVHEKQKVLRLLVTEILIFKDSMKIKHSIPVKKRLGVSQNPPEEDPDPSCYLLRGRRHIATFGKYLLT